jgi:hypothetical protein
VPSLKRKTGRTPLQRLGDQRRSLALVGLAAGAVLGATVFRRRRRGGEAEFGAPMPDPTPTPRASTPLAPSSPTGATSTASTPDVAATAAAATANQADPEAPEAAAAPAPEPEPASTTLSEPTTGELSAEEASILAVLAQHGRADDDRTVIAVATSLERESADVANVLRKLSTEGVVAGDLYTATGDKIWAVTERGVRRLGAQH